MAMDPTFPAGDNPARRPSRRDLLVGGTCLGVAALTYARMPRRKLASIPPGKLQTLAPDRIGEWIFETSSGIVLPPPDEAGRVLYDQQVTRAYISERTAPVMLVMAYGNTQGGMLQVHRPEICYPASGFRLTETVTGILKLASGHDVAVRSFTATSDTRTEQVMYWTRIGNALPTSWTGQRIAIMESNLSGLVPDGLLVRISTIGEAGAEGRAVLEGFARALLAAVGPTGRRQLLGASVA